MIAITPSQRRVLDYVGKFQKQCGWPPTRAEIAAAMNFASPNAAHEHLMALERKGYVKMERGQARGIKVLEGI